VRSRLLPYHFYQTRHRMTLGSFPHLLFQAVHYLLELVAVLERTFSIYTKENGRKVFALIDCICEFFEEAGVDKWITEDGGWDVSMES